MKNKNFLTGKKAIALLSVLGVTATLLSPLALNTTIFAEDNTTQIATRTAGDARSLTDDTILIDFNDYIDNESALINMLSSVDIETYIEIYNIPEGYTLEIPKDRLLTYVSLFIGGDQTSYVYNISLNAYINLKQDFLYLPKLEEMVNTDKDYVSQLVVEGTEFLTIDTQILYSQWDTETFFGDDTSGWLNTNEIGWLCLNKEKLNNYNNYTYGHIYTHEHGILKAYEEKDKTEDPSYSLYAPLFEIEGTDFIFASISTASTFYANQYADGSKENEAASYYTFDATDPDEQIQTLLQQGTSDMKVKDVTYYSIDSIIPAKRFELIQKYNLTYKIEVNSEIPYTLTFNEISEVKDLNTYMEFTKVTYGDELAFEFDFAHSGTLPGPMTVRMYVGPEYNTQTAYLYYKNSDGKLEKQASNAKVERGYAEFTITHCSTYVVSLNEINSDYTVESTDSTASTETETNANINSNDTGTSTDSTTSTETSTDSSLENVNNSTTTTSTKEDTNIDLTNEDSPVTGDTTQTALLLFTMVLAGIILVGSIKILKKARYF